MRKKITPKLYDHKIFEATWDYDPTTGQLVTKRTGKKVPIDYNQVYVNGHSYRTFGVIWAMYHKLTEYSHVRKIYRIGGNNGDNRIENLMRVPIGGDPITGKTVKHHKPGGRKHKGLSQNPENGVWTISIIFGNGRRVTRAYGSKKLARLASKPLMIECEKIAKGWKTSVTFSPRFP